MKSTTSTASGKPRLTTSAMIASIAAEGQKLRALNAGEQEPICKPVGRLGSGKPCAHLLLGDVADNRDVRARSL